MQLQVTTNVKSAGPLTRSNATLLYRVANQPHLRDGSAVASTACSAILLRCKLRVSVELQESTLLTTVCSHWHTFSPWRFRMTHELFLWLACMPARDKGCGHGIIRHKPLDHLAFAS
jgi:hypothetical protein